MRVAVLRRLLVFFGLAACTGAATPTGFAPVTSIVVRAESIIPPALCGKGPNQIAKYTAVVSAVSVDGGSAALSGQTYECFADAMFANMTGTQFEVDVFEWSASSFLAVETQLTGIEQQLRDVTVSSETKNMLLGVIADLKWTSRRQCTAVQVAS